jgi:hypothetical protein
MSADVGHFSFGESGPVTVGLPDQSEILGVALQDPSEIAEGAKRLRPTSCNAAGYRAGRAMATVAALT